MEIFIKKFIISNKQHKKALFYSFTIVNETYKHSRLEKSK